MLTIAKIQSTSRVMFDGIIIDEADLMVFLSSFFKINVREENMVFWITEVNLVRYTMTYFKTLWSLGEKFSLVALRT